MKKSRYALALGGGGTRGAYQVGVWRAIRELELEIIAITGTSIGAINAALMVQGDHTLLEKIYDEIDVDDIMDVSKPPNPDKNLFHITNITSLMNDFIKQKGISNEPLRAMISTYLDLDRLYDSDINFGLATFNLDKLATVELFRDKIKREKMVEHILASACFPIFKPEKIGSNKYIDGGAGDNLPINMLVEKGYNRIIAVDLNGMGIIRKIDNPDVYIKLIKPKDSLGGLFDFNKEHMKKNAQMGYMDTLKAFCKLQGHRYYFPLAEYKRMLNHFRQDTILALEFAASEYGMENAKIYRYRTFLNQLAKKHTEAMKEYNFIKNNITNIKAIHKKIQSGEVSINKSSVICYFFDQMIDNPLYMHGKDTVLLHEHIEAGRALVELNHFLEDRKRSY